jgi:hypothetical protein
MYPMAVKLALPFYKKTGSTKKIKGAILRELDAFSYVFKLKEIYCITKIFLLPKVLQRLFLI